MFLKLKILKGAMKQAYNGGGLRIMNTGDGFALLGAYWYVWLENATMPKKVRAAIVELVGELPAEGEAYKAQKDADNQYMIAENNYFWIRQKESGTKEMFPTRTYVELSNGSDLYQLVRCGAELKAFNANMVRMVDGNEIEEGEGYYTDPVEVYGGIYWQNDRCSYWLLPAAVEGKEKMECLEGMSHLNLF